MCDAFANSAAHITFIQACTSAFCRAVGMQLHYFVSSSGRKKFSQLQSSHTSLLLEGDSLIFFYTPMIAGEPKKLTAVKNLHAKQKDLRHQSQVFLSSGGGIRTYDTPGMNRML